MVKRHRYAHRKANECPDKCRPQKLQRSVVLLGFPEQPQLNDMPDGQTEPQKQAHPVERQPCMMAVGHVKGEGDDHQKHGEVDDDEQGRHPPSGRFAETVSVGQKAKADAENQLSRKAQHLRIPKGGVPSAYALDESLFVGDRAPVNKQDDVRQRRKPKPTEGSENQQIVRFGFVGSLQRDSDDDDKQRDGKPLKESA